MSCRRLASDTPRSWRTRLRQRSSLLRSRVRQERGARPQPLTSWPASGDVGRSAGLLMQAVTMKDAKRNLARLVEQVLADAEPRIVVAENGDQVVVIPLEHDKKYKDSPIG